MYKSIFQSILYPLYESVLRRRKTLKYLRFFNDSQWLPYSELESIQWKKLEKLLDHAYSNSPYYKQSFDSVAASPPTIKTYDDFLKLPICSREDVVKNNELMVASNYQKQLIDKTTGGSTGVPVRFAITRDSYEWRTAAAQRGYSWAGCEAGQHTLYLWGTDVGEPSFLSKTKTNLYHNFFNRKMFNCFDFGDAQMRECLNYINTKRPTGIVSFTTAIYNFAKFIDDNNLECKPVASVITGAEKLYPHQRELIEKALHTKVFNTYGCREFMLIASECEKHEGLHITMDNLFVEIIKDGKPAKPGESGDVVITDLNNYGMPFIRYRNGDVAIQSDKQCSCGRELPLIQDIDGRKMDEIIKPNGTALSGGFFPHLMKEFSEIEKFQVVQKSLNELLIKIIQKSSFTAERQVFCKTEIEKVLGSGVEINFEFVDEIPLSPSGKFRVTISEIAR